MIQGASNVIEDDVTIRDFLRTRNFSSKDVKKMVSKIFSLFFHWFNSNVYPAKISTTPLLFFSFSPSKPSGCERIASTVIPSFEISRVPPPHPLCSRVTPVHTWYTRTSAKESLDAALFSVRALEKVAAAAATLPDSRVSLRGGFTRTRAEELDSRNPMMKSIPVNERNDRQLPSLNPPSHVPSYVSIATVKNTRKKKKRKYCKITGCLTG